MPQTPDYLIFDREKSIRYSRVRISNVLGKSSSSNLAKLSSSGGIFAGAGFSSKYQISTRIVQFLKQA